MTNSDRVELVFVTHSNHLPVECYRFEASAIMQNWYITRDQILLDGPDAEKAAKHLKRGTYATTVISPAINTCLLTVGWEHVIGMYVRNPRHCPEKTL